MALRRRACLGWLALLAVLVPGVASAQHITIAGGVSGGRTLTGPNYLIGPSLGRQVGGNLFDSFANFNVAAGESATFTGPATVSNIIAGVTGGNPSTINGNVKSDIRGANLYLINPWGVVLGPHGTVNVSGSFYASTADYLKLGRNGRFQVTHPDGSKLTAAPPAAFGFLNAKPAAITVDGSRLTARGAIGLAGGAVLIKHQAKIVASTSSIDVTSLAGGGKVPVDPRRSHLLQVTRFGSAKIAGGSKLEVGNTTGHRHGGDVFIRSKSLTITASKIDAFDRGTGAGGEIVLRAGDKIALRDGAAVESMTTGSGRGAAVIATTAPGGSISEDAGELLTESGGGGASGRLSISTGRLSLRAGAAAGSIATGAGDAGRVSISGDSILIDGRTDPSATTVIGSVTTGAGNAGNVSVSANGLRMLANGEIFDTTVGLGNAGSIRVDVRGALSIDASGASLATGILSQADLGSGGNAGRLAVDAGSLSITDGGEISASTLGPGLGGDVSVSVDRDLRIRGGAATSIATGIFSNTIAAGDGPAGDVTVSAGDLRIGTNGEISSSTGGSAGAGEVSVTVARQLEINGPAATQLTGIVSDSSATATGSAGTVLVSARALRIGANGQISSGTFGSGSGGRVTIDVADALNIDGADAEAGILTGIAAEADAGSTGNSGELTVAAGSISLTSGGEISGSTFGAGNAGEVSVTARRLRVAGPNSEIASNTTGSGNAGQVSVGVTGRGSGALTILANGEIGAGTFAAGDAGNVLVDVAGGLTIDGRRGNPATITGIASQANRGSTGNAGSVTVFAGNLFVLANGQVSSGTFARGRGGSVSVSAAHRLEIDGARAAPGILTGVTSEADSGSSARAGDVAVEAGRLLVADGGEISSDTFGTGDAGSVSVTAKAMSVAGGGEISSDSDAGSSGNAGNVRIGAGRLDIDGGVISSGLLAASSGAPASTGEHAGDVTVDVAGRLAIEGSKSRLSGIVADSNRGTIGVAGNVRVAAAALSIGGDGQIASSTFGAGHGGNVSVGVAGLLKIDAAGADPRYLTGITSEANAGSTGAAGNVAVIAGTLAVADGGAITSDTFGARNAGTVAVDAGVLSLADGGLISSDSGAGSSGNAGNVTVVASRRLDIADGLISSGLLGASGGAPASRGKHAGDVTVTAGGFLSIVGSRSSALSGIATDANPGTIGDAGNVRVSAGGLSISRNGEISSGTAGAGKGGRIAVDVAGGLSIDGRGADPVFVTGIASQADPGSTGDAGDVLVRSGTLSIVDGGAITSSVIGARDRLPAGIGNAGRVTVKVSGQLSIEGGQIATTADPGTVGNAGAVAVSAGAIELAHAGDIVSTTAGMGAGGSVVVMTRGALVLDGDGQPGTEIAASATGLQSGAAGAVTVTAGSLMIGDGGMIASSTAGNGAGGDVSVSASSDVTLSGPGPEITAQSTGIGDAGSVDVSASRLFLNDGAGISTGAEASTANGGNVGLSLRDLLYLTDGEITTSVEGETGNGGNITVAAPYVIFDDGNVIAQAVEGHGGNITIDAGEYIPSAGSVVSASSAFGVSGNVVISGPLVELNGSLVALSSALRNPASLTRDSCAATADRPQSSLVEAGRGGLSQDPSATLPALYLAGRDVQLGPRVVVPRRADAGDLRSTLRLSGRCG